MAEKPQPVQVLYCEVCGLPAEYCEFGPDFEKCKPWLAENAPDLYPDIFKESGGKDADKVSDKLQSTSISSGATQTAVCSKPKEEEVQRLPGGKTKKKEKAEVIIEKMTRNKRKCITTVKGLELFGVKLNEASKKLGKKFATGASVVKLLEFNTSNDAMHVGSQQKRPLCIITKGPTEKDQIDVQGDISPDIVNFITDTWPDVPKIAIFIIEDGKRIPAK